MINANPCKRVLINMSNIHGGGALQVAISFVSELLNIENPFSNVKVLISHEIYESCEISKLAGSSWNFEVFNTHGIAALFSKLNKEQFFYDVVFTLFGPKYTFFKSKIDIVGFAQSWIINFDNPVSANLSFYEKNKLRFKYQLQKIFFKHADHLVVELEHVKDSIVKSNFFKSNNVSVIHNTISSLYCDDSLWHECVIKRKPNEIAIGFISRDYNHKNIKVLPFVAKLLNENYNLPIRFYLTLNELEWQNYKDDFASLGETVGPLNVYQCPSFYSQMDAVIFPSVLECFSASPLEALVMKKPLFASDKAFVRDVCKDYPIYFDPLSVENIALVIASYFTGERKTAKEFEDAKNHVFSFSNARNRAEGYLKIIESYIES